MIENRVSGGWQARRISAGGAFLAALALAVSGLVQLAMVYPESGPGVLGSTSATLIESAHAVAWAGMILAFIGVRAQHRAAFGRLGKVSFYLATIGNLSFIMITIVVLVVGSWAASPEAVFAPGSTGETLANWFALAGFLTLLVWIPLMGVAIWRAGVAPRRVAVAFFVHPLFMLALLASYGFGGLGIGALWLAIGLVLWPRRVAEDIRPSMA